jgi:hypothetical protein
VKLNAAEGTVVEAASKQADNVAERIAGYPIEPVNMSQPGKVAVTAMRTFAVRVKYGKQGAQFVPTPAAGRAFERPGISDPLGQTPSFSDQTLSAFHATEHLLEKLHQHYETAKLTN